MKFTVEQKTELLELLYVRLDTIKDDPDSADQFETEERLTILEDKIKNDQGFTQAEIEWMDGEVNQNEDVFPIRKSIANLLAPYIVRPMISIVRVADADASKFKVPLRKVAWSDDKHTQIFQYGDGGRAKAGYKGLTGDCVCRAVCIASGLPYQEVYDRLAEGNATQRKGNEPRGQRGRSGQKTAAHGINVKRKWFKEYMESIGFEWIPTMFIGSGCKVHLRGDELPKGNLVITVSGHYTAMIDGILYDSYDCSRQGTRCVYGYYIKK